MTLGAELFLSGGPALRPLIRHALQFVGERKVTTLRFENAFLCLCHLPVVERYVFTNCLGSNE